MITNNIGRHIHYYFEPSRLYSSRGKGKFSHYNLAIDTFNLSSINFNRSLY
jgi:hypothetical protein